MPHRQRRRLRVTMAEYLAGSEEENAGFEVLSSDPPPVLILSENSFSSGTDDSLSLELDECPFDEAVELRMPVLLDTDGGEGILDDDDSAELPRCSILNCRPPKSPQPTSRQPTSPRPFYHCLGMERSQFVLPVLPDLIDMAGCPCCHQCLDDGKGEVDTTLVSPPSRTISPVARNVSLISAAESVEEAEQQAQKLNREMTTTGVSTEGISYLIKRVLVEGLLYKKGSGSDWMKSRSWKARWTRLVLGWVEGYGDILVPLLCISWFPQSKSISTVIVLDSTVLLSLDQLEKDHRHRFEIRHATSKENSTLPESRTFAAPTQKARDSWVFAISEALLSYSKEKAKSRKKFPRMTSFRPQHLGLKSALHLEDVFPEPHFTTVEGNWAGCQSSCPPMSPPVFRTSIASPSPPRPKRPICPHNPTAPASAMVVVGKKDVSPRAPQRSTCDADHEPDSDHEPKADQSPRCPQRTKDENVDLFQPILPIL